MKKLISISTTTRSPYRIKEQLPIFKEYFDGSDWSMREIQLEFFIRLIQYRLYDPTKGSSNPLPENLRILLESDLDISFEDAKKIVKICNYDDPYRRGRTAIDTQFKLGFLAKYNNIIKITELGHELLNDNVNDTISFLKALLKWQLPNIKQERYYKEEDGYSTVPLIATIKLIKKVNQIMKKNSLSESGITKNEFNIFVPTLINFNLIDNYANQIIEFRKKFKKINKPREQKAFIEEYKNNKFGDFDMNNSKDYGDNLRRYFLYTGLFKYNGFYFNLKEDRNEIIQQIIKLENNIKTIDTLDNFYDYIGSDKVENLKIVIIDKEKPELNLKNIEKAKTVEFVNTALEDLNLLKNRDYRFGMGIDAERFMLKFLYILDTTKQIKSNSPSFDDEGYPIATAPSLQPDLQSFYDDFAVLGEVTTITSRTQIRESEMQSISRHTREFENNSSINQTFLLFLAPIIHRDMINQFHFYTTRHNPHGYEGRNLNVVPLSFEHTEKLLNRFKDMYSRNKLITQNELKLFFENIVKHATDYSSDVWSQKILETINNFQNNNS